jgi:hypothetical protein
MWLEGMSKGIPIFLHMWKNPEQPTSDPSGVLVRPCFISWPKDTTFLISGNFFRKNIFLFFLKKVSKIVASSKLCRIFMLSKLKRGVTSLKTEKRL